MEQKSYSNKNVYVGFYLKPNSSLVCDLAYCTFSTFPLGLVVVDDHKPCHIPSDIYHFWFPSVVIFKDCVYLVILFPFCEKSSEIVPSKMFKKKNYARQKLARKIRQEPFFLPKIQWDIVNYISVIITKYNFWFCHRITFLLVPFWTDKNGNIIYLLLIAST